MYDFARATSSKGIEVSSASQKELVKVDSGEAAVHVGEVKVLAEESDLQAAVRAQINHRRLNPRQIQLTSIAGAIGAALFVAIGSGVTSGPLCLLLGFVFWATVVLSIAECQKEIVTLFPLDASYIRLAGRIVDPGLAVAAGWNNFFAQTSYVIFEATVINTLVAYWGYDHSPAILITVSLLLYLGLNIYRADVFGEAEFWLALGKVLLATGLMVFTFVTMVGGNPKHDPYGFRYWKTPGPWNGSGSKGLTSWLNAVNVAGFIMGGPDYLSIIAGEARDPRRTMPRAFKSLMFRLMFFFVGGSFCVGILVPYDEPKLTTKTHVFTGTSPYVIAMERLNVKVLPSIFTAALLTSITSAGNCYTFNASRSLHGLALEGMAPKFLRRLNRKGTPYMAVASVIALGCLAYLALGSGSAAVLHWLLNFCTAAGMLNWTIMSFTWVRFNAAMKVQGLDRTAFLPTISRWQPYAAYWALFWAFLFLWLQGYAVFLKGNWSTPTFIFDYGIIGLAAGIGLGWKIVKRTPFRRLEDIDLHSDLELFEALTEHYRNEREAAPVTLQDEIMHKIF